MLPMRVAIPVHATIAGNEVIAVAAEIVATVASAVAAEKDASAVPTGNGIAVAKETSGEALPR